MVWDYERWQRVRVKVAWGHVQSNYSVCLSWNFNCPVQRWAHSSSPSRSLPLSLRSGHNLRRGWRLYAPFLRVSTSVVDECSKDPLLGHDLRLWFEASGSISWGSWSWGCGLGLVMGLRLRLRAGLYVPISGPVHCPRREVRIHRSCPLCSYCVRLVRYQHQPPLVLFIAAWEINLSLAATLQMNSRIFKIKFILL